MGMSVSLFACSGPSGTSTGGDGDTFLLLYWFSSGACCARPNRTGGDHGRQWRGGWGEASLFPSGVGVEHRAALITNVLAPLFVNNTYRVRVPRSKA